MSPRDELRRLAREATAGPWHAAAPNVDGCYAAANGFYDQPRPPNATGMFCIHTPGTVVVEEWAAHAVDSGLAVRPEDAAYIAAASPDRILALLDANDTLTARLAAVEGALRTLVDNAVPPDALMVPDWGDANRNLYDWWHLRCAPALMAARAVLTDPATPLSATSETTT